MEWGTKVDIASGLTVMVESDTGNVHAAIQQIKQELVEELKAELKAKLMEEIREEIGAEIKLEIEAKAKENGAAAVKEIQLVQARMREGLKAELLAELKRQVAGTLEEPKQATVPDGSGGPRSTNGDSGNLDTARGPSVAKVRATGEPDNPFGQVVDENDDSQSNFDPASHSFDSDIELDSLIRLTVSRTASACLAMLQPSLRKWQKKTVQTRMRGMLENMVQSTFLEWKEMKKASEESRDKQAGSWSSGVELANSPCEETEDSNAKLEDKEGGPVVDVEDDGPTRAPDDVGGASPKRSAAITFSATTSGVGLDDSNESDKARAAWIDIVTTMNRHRDAILQDIYRVKLLTMAEVRSAVSEVGMRADRLDCTILAFEDRLRHKV